METMNSLEMGLCMKFCRGCYSVSCRMIDTSAPTYYIGSQDHTLNSTASVCTSLALCLIFNLISGLHKSGSSLDIFSPIFQCGPMNNFFFWISLSSWIIEDKLLVQSWCTVCNFR